MEMNKAEGKEEGGKGGRQGLEQMMHVTLNINEGDERESRGREGRRMTGKETRRMTEG